MYPNSDEEILAQYGGEIRNNLNSILGTYEDDESENKINTFQHSRYYDWDGLQNVLITNKDSFSILSLNCQSIHAKFDKILTLLDHLKSKQCQLSAICIQETWLNSTDDTSLLNIPGYNLISKGKQITGYGGLIIYLQDTFTFSDKNGQITSSRWEGIFIDVNHDKLNKKNYTW